MNRVDEATLALREAVQADLADLAAGRFTDIEPDAIDAFMEKLSADAGNRCKPNRRKN